MVDIFRFLKPAEPWIYVILSILGVYYLRMLFLAIHEYRNCLFGLEKNKARGKLSGSIGALTVLFLLGISEFVFVTYASVVVPSLALLPTPTLNLQSTMTPAGSLPLGGEIIPQTTIEFSAGGSPGGGCIPGKLEWSEPASGSEISGTVMLKGTVNIPDFGFYKYEYSQDNLNWNTIQAGTNIVINEKLGDWDTSILPSGDYSLRLVVTNHQAEAFPPCLLNVKVVPVR